MPFFFLIFHLKKTVNFITPQLSSQIKILLAILLECKQVNYTRLIINEDIERMKDLTVYFCFIQSKRQEPYTVTTKQNPNRNTNT